MLRAVEPDLFRAGEERMSTRVNSVVRWTARVTAVAIAVVFFMFVLGESRGSLRSISPRDWAGMLFLFGAIAAMVLAWKWELPAALISLFALGAFAAVVHINRYGVLAILAIPNVLFLLDWTLRRLHSTEIS
jgi:phosphoglycerol transferase MdoB-like AlkP superfamily enzyme